MLSSAVSHYRRQQRITAAGLGASRRAGSVAKLVEVVAAYQVVAARDAVDSVPLMLAEQGIADDAVASVAVSRFAGVASDGRPLESLFAQARNDLARDLMVATQIQDAARTAAGVTVAATPSVSGYVRMLNPPSCSRCAVLAGRFYRWNAGFQRHPRCDCRHIPSTETLAKDLTTNPNMYFDSLSPAQQDKFFTKAGAEAIRDGADVSQVVNARRGMSMAGESQTASRVINGETFTVNVQRRSLAAEQVGGRDVFLSTEGTTKRGVASRQKTGRNMSKRLMPETIYKVADDRADAIRLLKAHGYLI